MDNRKYSLILPVVAVFTPYSQAQEAIEVENFNARIWRDADLKDVQKRNSVLATAIMVFQDSLREHYDNVREKNKTNLLKTGKGCNYKYFLSVYEVIPTELVKMVYNIQIKGDSVSYVKDNEKKILECISGGGNITKI